MIERLKTLLDRIENQTVKVTDCSIEMLTWIESGPNMARELIAKIEGLEMNSCSECSPDNYGWIFNRVEGKAACGCMTEAEPFQILLTALEKLARLGNGDRFGNSDGNRIAIDALQAVLPLDYEE